MSFADNKKKLSGKVYKTTRTTVKKELKTARIESELIDEINNRGLKFGEVVNEALKRYLK